MKKKKIQLLMASIILLILCVISCIYFGNRYTLKKNLENAILPFASKNEYPIFKITDILFFSSSDAKGKTSSSSHFTIENLYQYTDLAIFIKNATDPLTLENTLKKVWIENITIENKPSLGEPSLYFKSMNNFSKSDIIEDNLIHDTLEFAVTSSDETSLDTPVLYNNLANPLTLSYVNKNIKTDYTFTNPTTPITYDGSLLKRCAITLTDISCKLSFDIHIINNLDQQFKSSIFINIPLENEGKSIYDSNFTKKEKVNYTFYRYQ